MRLLEYLRARWKKIAKISFLVIVSLYFIANLGLFFYIVEITDDNKVLNAVPESVSLPRAEVEGASLPYNGVQNGLSL